MALIWIVDALLDALARGNLSLSAAIAANPHEFSLRLLLVGLVAGFGFLIWRTLRRREQLHDEVQNARRQAEEARAWTEGVLAAIGDGVSIQDTDFRVLFQNQAHRQLVGGDFHGSICYQVYDCRQTICPDCPVAAALADGRVHVLEKNLADPRDGRTHIEIVASPLRDHAGNIVGGVEVVRDISRRKQVEQASVLQAEFLQRLIDTIPNPIFYKDRDGRYLGCNQAFLDFIGTERQGLVGRTVEELAPADLAARYREMDEELLAGGGTQVYEHQVQAADGSQRSVLFSKASYQDVGGGIGGLVGVILDITERQQAEQRIRDLNLALQRQTAELLAGNRELEAFAYSLSHDLQTPLSRVSLAAELLEEKVFSELDETGQFCVVRIREGCDTIEKLIDAMLKLSQVSRRELVREEFDLSGCAREILAGLRQAEPARRVAFSCQEDLRVEGDPQLLRVLLVNLLNNAWKYTAGCSETQISFGCDRQGGAPVFFLADNGVGFDSEKSVGLFEPFRRFHPDEKFPGAGIGLATVKRVVSRHGGQVWADSRPGEGATFFFTLG